MNKTWLWARLVVALVAGLLAAGAAVAPASANPLLECGTDQIYENNGACGNGG
jgi:hypothetical protein